MEHRVKPGGDDRIGGKRRTVSDASAVPTCSQSAWASLRSTHLRLLRLLQPAGGGKLVQVAGREDKDSRCPNLCCQVPHPCELFVLIRVFGRGKYAEARVTYAPFYHLVDALLLTNTFVLLGCGLNDPDFWLLFENFSYRFPNAPPHYMTYADGSHEELEELVHDTQKLKFLKYSRAHDHKELEESLATLLIEVEKERQEMGASLNW